MTKKRTERDSITDIQWWPGRSVPGLQERGGRVCIIHRTLSKLLLPSAEFSGRRTCCSVLEQASVGVHQPLGSSNRDDSSLAIYPPNLACFIYFFFYFEANLFSFILFILCSLCLLCAAVAGRPGIWGPGGGSGVQGPWESPPAGPMVPPGRGDPGLPRFSHSPEKWDCLLSTFLYVTNEFITANNQNIALVSLFTCDLSKSEPRSAAESGTSPGFPLASIKATFFSAAANY